MNLSKINRARTLLMDPHRQTRLLIGQSVIVLDGGQEMPATIINFNNWTENASRTVAVELGTGEIFDCKISQIKAEKRG